MEGGHPQKDFSSCFLRVWAQITRLEVKKINSNIILTRGAKREGTSPKRFFFMFSTSLGLNKTQED